MGWEAPEKLGGQGVDIMAAVSLSVLLVIPNGPWRLRKANR